MVSPVLQSLSDVHPLPLPIQLPGVGGVVVSSNPTQVSFNLKILTHEFVLLFVPPLISGLKSSSILNISFGSGIITILLVPPLS